MAAQWSPEDHYGLKGRVLHRAVSVGDSLYVWAGGQDGLPVVHDSEEKRKFTSNIQHFTPSTGQWVSRATTGTPPLGVINYSCTAIDDQLYYFGGACGHDDCYHNNITQLDTVSLQWRELEPTDATRPVMMRAAGGMISLEHDGVHHLLMIGGIGSEPAVQLPHYKYNRLPSGKWRSSEHSMYNLSSRVWDIPEVIGQCVTLFGGFVMEKLNNIRAIVFGGSELDAAAGSDVYILNISILINTVFWQCIKKPMLGRCPKWRYYHAGAIFGTRPEEKFLLVSGGMNSDHNIISDCWIYSINQQSWKQVALPPSVCKRWGHSLSVFIMCPHCVWIITVGGVMISGQFYDDAGLIKDHNVVMLTELVLKSSGDWLVGDTLSSKDHSEVYKSKFQHRLQLEGREWALLEHQREQEKKLLQNIQELKDKNAELQEQLDVKLNNEQELHKQSKAFVDELQEKKKEVILMKEQYQQQLKEIEEKDLQLTQSKEKGEALQFELNKKQEEFTKKEKELSELQQLYHSKKEELATIQEGFAKKEDFSRELHQLHHSKKEELAKIENEFKHQLEKKEQEIQEYSHLLQECQDALCTQKLKNESQNIQLLHHSPQVVLSNDEQQSKEKEIRALTMQLEDMERTLELKEKEIQERADTLNAQKVNHLSQATQCNIETADNATQVQKEQNNIDAGTQCDLEIKSQGTSIGIQCDYLIPLIDKLQGVCVAGDKLFLLQNDSPQLLNWEEYGLRIAIPQGVVQQSDTVEVAITALVGGEFILPEDTELVSAVYAISVSKPLLKPVQLEIQHCVSIEKPAHSNYLTFATAPSSCPPYHFQPVEGGIFSISNQYGGISLSGFSIWSIIKKKFKRRGHSQSFTASSHINSLSSTDAPPLSQSPSSANALPSPPHTQPSPPDNTPSAPPDDALPSPSNTSPMTNDTASVPLSPSSNPPLSSSPAIVSSTFSLPSTDNTVASSANVSVESSSSILSTVDDSLQHSAKDESPVKNYFGQVMYEKLQPEREWLMRFLLSKDLNALKEFIHKEIHKEIKNFNLGSKITFNFEDDDGYIELCFDTVQCTKGWSVIPNEVPTKVNQSTIDLYGSISPPHFPERLITITFTPGDDTELQLRHPVTLKGIKSATEKLNIILTIRDHHSAANTTKAHMTPHDKGDTAKNVFRDHYADLYDLLAKLDDISALALRLYSKKLITEDAYDNISTSGRTGRDKAESVLRALKATISIQPQSLRTLIEILKKNDALKVIAEKMDLEMSFHTYTEQ